MFITSTFSVIRSSSLWPYFHASVILPYILQTISWINVVLRILVLCDTKIDIFANVSHLDLYSRLSLSRTSRDLIKMFELSVVRDNQIVTS